MTLSDLSPVDCPHGGGKACPKCVRMCNRPCWPTPDDARALIEAGHAGSLMLDHWVGDDSDIFILCGANPGYQMQEAPDVGFGLFSMSPLESGCIFLNDEKRCSLHDAGLKPLEGRLADCTATQRPKINVHEEIAKLWDSKDARDLVRRWHDIVGLRSSRFLDQVA